MGRPWPQVGPNTSRLGPNLGITCAELGPLGFNLGQTSGQLGSNNAQNGATWASLAEVGPRRSSPQDRWGTRPSTNKIVSGKNALCQIGLGWAQLETKF